MLICVGLVIVGTVLGSFAGAQIWRLRVRELAMYAKSGELSSAEKHQYAQLRRLQVKSLRDDHSRCLQCGHRLDWYDLIPLISWLSTRGKCRYCRQAIGTMEPMIELFMAGFMILSYMLVFAGEPLSALLAVRVLLWTAAGVCIAILFWYDLRWYILPLSINMTLILSSLTYAVIMTTVSVEPLATVWSTLVGLVILSGVYLALYMASGGKWVGGGDYKLAAGLALLLGDWRLAIATLFLSNLIGLLAVMPGMLRGRIDAKSHVPFGPLLIAGFMVALWLSEHIIWFFDTYLFT